MSSSKRSKIDIDFQTPDDIYKTFLSAAPNDDDLPELKHVTKLSPLKRQNPKQLNLNYEIAHNQKKKSKPTKKKTKPSKKVI